ncbi:Adenine-specific methyltransferase (plasmid) [Borrelia miyamotoi FR64b]|uniref:Adenine-specific methyltransferase n=1 Tax=Borrelia miyamotoi FR64b TaxID=1292392 RepID=W5SFW8_9SPIR|nr:Adenine-specific methyltransferase [Borrelia miyamotoi FR64b]
MYEFTIDNYQAIKNYLKYRKGKELSINEIEHLKRLFVLLIIR